MSMQTQTDPERPEDAQAPTTTDNDLTLQMLDISRSLGRLEGASQNFATKSDVAEAEQRMSEKISAVAAEVAEAEQRMSEKVADVRTEVAAVKAEVAQVEQRMSEKISAVAAEVAQVESRLIKWIVGTGVVLFIGLGGLLFALLQWLISTLP